VRNNPAMTTPAPRKIPTWLKIGGLGFAVLVALAIIGAIFGPKEEPEPAASEATTTIAAPRTAQAQTTTEEPATTTEAPPTTTTTTSAAAAPTTQPDAARQQQDQALATLEGCTPASDSVVAFLETMITEGGLRLDDAYVVDGAKGQYVGANFFDETDRRVSSADVWINRNGVWYALSSDARSRTSLPDGRDYASAGDEDGTAVQDCVTAAIFAR
jgi:hypothetical protein